MSFFFSTDVDVGDVYSRHLLETDVFIKLHIVFNLI